MKFPFFKRSTSSEPAPEAGLRSPISAEAYRALPPEEQAAYRPIDPRYERLPVVCIVLYALAGVSLILYAIICNSVAFADWFNGTVGAAFRTVLGLLTAWVPFSVGELIIWLLPLSLWLVLRHAIRRRCDTWRAAAVYVGILMSVAVTILSLFVLTFSAGYRGSTLDEKLELSQEKVSATELYDTAVILIERINAESEQIQYGKDDFSSMPYTFADMNHHLSDAYATFAADHDFIQHTAMPVKPVLLSEVMSHMHITGVYSFFTGEANVNVGFPDYTLPYTAAHEMAHQRGVAREDEANFVAFLVCMESDDPYVRYSGYLNVYEFVANALYSADRDLYFEAVGQLEPSVIREMEAYSDFYDQYRDSTVSNISSGINNSYLQSQGTPGTRSYGMVVDLVVAYHKAGGFASGE